MLTIGKLTIAYNRAERAWEVTGSNKKSQRFGTGARGRRLAIKFAITQAFPAIATAVTCLCEKEDQASGRAWAAAQLVIAGHVLDPGSEAKPNHVARVVSQKNGRFPHHYYIGHHEDGLTCTCPDYEAGGIIVADQSLCKHSLAYLLARHVQWLLTKGVPDTATKLRREANRHWQEQTAVCPKPTIATQNHQSQMTTPA